MNGFVDEYTVVEPGTNRHELIKGFYNVTGAGGPEESIVVGDHDYFTFPVGCSERSVAPRSFGGMSGGGLWQVPVVRDAQGQIEHDIPLLSGVVFYQVPTTDAYCGVKSHGRKSVYRVAYHAIAHAFSA